MATEEKKTIVESIEPVTASEEASADVIGAEPEAKKVVKKSKRQIQKGRATIQCTYNNTIITISDMSGAALGWSSSGHLGFKGAKKSTPYAATQVVADLVEKIRKYGMEELEVFVRGVGSGREASIRALSNNGFNLTSIKDLTPIPHNGCRPKRPRRI